MHGVDAGALELLHVASRRVGELGDRELARRDVGQQLEQPVERCCSSSAASAESSRISGSTLLEDALELVLVAHADDDTRGRARGSAPRCSVERVAVARP